MMIEIIEGLIAGTVSFLAGMATQRILDKTRIETLEAARDWWREHALGNHKAGKYPPNPPGVQR